MKERVIARGAGRRYNPGVPRLNPNLFNGDGTVVAQTPYGPGCWKMTISVPHAGPVAAGQFCHVNCADRDPLLRRPFSYWDARPAGDGIAHVDILYTVVGRGTALLAGRRPRERVGYMGPVGRGFTLRRDRRAYVFVAGGVGIVPFYLFARQVRAAGHDARMVLLFGARTKDFLWGIDDFPALGVEVHAATDDGSRGRKGFVTELLEDWIGRVPGTELMLYACGPEKMLDRVAETAQKTGLPCEISMERRMGCALGACGACVTPVKDGADWRFSRICWEGPTYDARDLVLGEPWCAPTATSSCAR
jgi:dihydroorotate dehydrogenase electron transfer subunit